MAQPTCPLGSHGATAGGLHPEEDGVTSKAGGPLGTFVIVPILPVIWTEELVLFRDKTQKTHPSDHKSTRGYLLANGNFCGFNALFLMLSACIWRSWRESFDFKGFLTGLC